MHTGKKVKEGVVEHNGSNKRPRVSGERRATRSSTHEGSPPSPSRKRHKAADAEEDAGVTPGMMADVDPVLLANLREGAVSQKLDMIRY